MGAVTVANKFVGSNDGRNKRVEADVTFSSSYATGGDTFDPKLVGLRAVREVVVPSHDMRTKKAIATASTRAGKTVELAGTEVAPLLKVFDTANTEVANATSLTGVTLRLRFIGY